MRLGYKGNRKGMDSSGLGILAALVLIVFLLSMLIPSIRERVVNFFSTQKNISSCEGFGFVNGKCVASKAMCDGPAFSGLGCKEKEKPFCCFADEEQTGAADSMFSDCKYVPKNTWKDCNSCRVKFQNMAINQANPVMEDEDFTVTCYTNVNDVPCLAGVQVKNIDTDKEYYCELPASTITEKNYYTFKCEGVPAGTYLVKCRFLQESEEHSCCVNEGNTEFPGSMTVNAKE